MKENSVCSKGQVPENEHITFLGNGKRKVLIFGNSITRHGRAPALGWFSDCGMAASCAEKDYVHLLYDAMHDSVLSYRQRISNGSFEGTVVFHEFRAVKDFVPISSRQVGENVSSNAYKKANLHKLIKRLLDYCRQRYEIDFDDLLGKSVVDDEIRALAKSGCALAELNDLGARDEMKACGLFSHTGVAAHPGDRGMREIAERILRAMEKSQ
ncbi:MAG: hypothetical protein ACLRTQ_09295 [Candidatus Borkfalkia sp.]